MSLLEWSHSEEELLIDFYAKHESLYNKHHVDYNYNHKNKLLTELVKELNKQSGGKKFKVDNVSTHWNELRNIYNQHKRRVIKDELTSNRSVQIQPEWIWWRKMTYIFTGVTLPDNINRQTSDVVHQKTNDNNDLSPVKRNVRSKPITQGTPTVSNNKRRTTMAPPKDSSVSPRKIRRRRSIHSLSCNDTSAPNNTEDTETEFECEISVTPIAANGRQKRVSALLNSNRQLSTKVTEKPESKRISSVLSKSVVTTQSFRPLEEEHVKPKGRRTVKMQTTVTPMEVDVDTSSTQSGNDECTSTAMFVESRLRTYDDFKRQRMIFQIRELFYQEDR